MTAVTFTPEVGGSGLAYSDDGTTARTMPGGGHKTHLFASLAELVTVAQNANDSSLVATGTANATGTSTTSIAATAVGADTATITTQSGKTWVPGQMVMIANTANPASQWLRGFVKTYTGTALVVTAVDSFGTFPGTSWTISPAPFQRVSAMILSPITVAFHQVNLGDAGRVFTNGQSGSVLLALPAISTVPSGWSFYVKHAVAVSSVDTLTIAPAGSDLISGVSSVVMYPAEMRLVYSDGAQWQSVVLAPFVRFFGASATWVKPPGYRAFRVKAVGGGGGGGGGRSGTTSNSLSGVGGHGGTADWNTFSSAELPSTVAVIVGAGGAAGQNQINNVGLAGGAGGTSSFHTVSASGGAGGAGGTTNANGAVNSDVVNSWFASAASGAFTGATQPGNVNVTPFGALRGGGGGSNCAAGQTTNNPGGSTVEGGSGGASSYFFIAGSGHNNSAVAGTTARSDAMGAFTGWGAVPRNSASGGAAADGSSGGGGGAGGPGYWNTDNGNNRGGAGGAGMVTVIGVI